MSDREAVRRETATPAGLIQTIVWTIGFLAVMDLAVNRLFPYPADPAVEKPSALASYFEYGRSIEGKLQRMIGPTDATTAKLAQSGWLQHREPQAYLPTACGRDGGMLIAAYGMSFTERVCNAAASQDERLEVRMLGGPSAPLNHSYALFVEDLDRHEADVAVLGILASSLSAIRSQTHMTWNFEAPAAFTYPRYELVDGMLQSDSQIIRSLEEFREVRGDAEAWKNFRLNLANADAYYDDFSFRTGPGDYSAVVRMVRRAWGQGNKREVESEMHNRDGFVDCDGALTTARFLVQDFARKASQHGMLPVVLLFNDRGYSDHLFQVFEMTLRNNRIPFVSTHELAPADNLLNFQSDGHFQPDVDQKLAEQLLLLIQRNRQPSGLKHASHGPPDSGSLPADTASLKAANRPPQVMKKL